MVQGSVVTPIASWQMLNWEIVPGGQGTTQCSLDIDNPKMNIERKREGLTGMRINKRRRREDYG